VKELLEEFLKFLYELRKWGDGKGEEKGEKGDSANQLPLAIEGRLII